MLLIYVDTLGFLPAICCGIQCFHFISDFCWTTTSLSFSGLIPDRKGISGPRIICCLSLLGSLFTNAPSNKLGKGLKSISASFEMLSSFWVCISSDLYRIQHSISTRGSGQRILLADTIKPVGSQVRRFKWVFQCLLFLFFIFFCSEFHSNLVSLGIGNTQNFKWGFHRKPKDPPVFRLPVYWQSQ